MQDKMFSILIIFSTLLGPFLAVQAQEWVERSKESRKRKNNIFQTLMVSRATALSERHVEALNSIKFVFSKKKQKRKRNYRCL